MQHAYEDGFFFIFTIILSLLFCFYCYYKFFSPTRARVLIKFLFVAGCLLIMFIRVSAFVLHLGLKSLQYSYLLSSYCMELNSIMPNSSFIIFVTSYLKSQFMLK